MSLKLNGWFCPGEITNGTHILVTPTSTNESKGIVLCIHGIGSYHSCFNFLSNDLSLNGYTVIQYDLIGRGFSAVSPTNQYTLEDHITQLLQVIQDSNHLLSENNRSFHIIAHSMGGSLATIFASRYPDQVRSLTLLAPAGLMDLGPLRIIRSSGFIQALVKPVIKSNQVNAWKKDFFSHKNDSLLLENDMIMNQTIMYQNNPHAFRAFWKSAMQFPLSDIQEHVTIIAKNHNIPILLLVSKNDVAVPMTPSYTRWISILNEFRSNISEENFHTKVYDNAAHGFFIEFYNIVNNDILSFLSKL
eukprot:gene17124-23568_t